MAILTSLYTGISGINSNGASLSVIGDNIANMNTSGFKASKANFGDILSSSFSGGSGASQIGRGSFLSSVSTQFAQGSFETTANGLDMAIDGSGFFLLEAADGTINYSRAGAMGLNRDGFIVNPAGLRLQGYQYDATGANTGVIDSLNIASLSSPPSATTEVVLTANLDSRSSGDSVIVDATNNSISFDNGGGATTINLTPGTYTGDALASELQTQLNAVAGTDVTVTFDAATQRFTILNNDSNGYNIAWEDTANSTAAAILGFNTGYNFTVNGTNNTIAFTIDVGGTDTAASATLNSGNYSAAQMAAEVERAMEAAALAAGYTHDYTVDFSGTTNIFSVTNGTVAAGNEDIAILWNDATTTAEGILGYDAVVGATIAAGATDTADVAARPGWINAGAADTSDQAAPLYQSAFDVNSPSSTSDFSSSITVYDTLGNGHQITMYFRKSDVTSAGNTWEWFAVIPASESLTGINTIGASGTVGFSTAGAYTGTTTTTAADFDFAGGAALSQSMLFDFTELTQYGTTSATIFQNQDGFGSGSIQSVSINDEGIITGVFTNGQTRGVGQVALARFINQEGLTKQGGNLFTESFNSGPAIVGSPGASGLGNILSSTLELSNVDLANEFVSMISAQRGFQANSRVVSATDEILNELVNLRR